MLLVLVLVYVIEVALPDHVLAEAVPPDVPVDAVKPPNEEPLIVNAVIVLEEDMVIVLPDKLVPDLASRYMRKSVFPSVTSVLFFQKIAGVLEEEPCAKLILIPELVYDDSVDKAILEFALLGAGNAGVKAARPASVVKVNVTSVPHICPMPRDNNKMVTSHRVLVKKDLFCIYFIF